MFLGLIVFYMDTPSPGGVLTASSILLIGSVWMGVYGIALGAKLDALWHFPDAVRTASTGSEELRRQYNRMTTVAEGVQQAVVRESDVIGALIDQAKVSRKERADMDARLSSAIADKKIAETELGHWQDRLVATTRSLERALSLDGLGDQYIAATEKAVKDIEKQYAPLGFRVIRPAVGDEHDDLLHEVAGEVRTASIETGKVAQVESWGFTYGDERICARVYLAGTEASNAQEQNGSEGEGQGDE